MSDTKPNIYDSPNTVVIDGNQLTVLPKIQELVPFIEEYVLREQENKGIFEQIQDSVL